MNRKHFLIPLLTLLILELLFLAGSLYFCRWGEDFYCLNKDGFVVFYSENIRGHVFAGFLALAGFLMSLKTFIIVTMKENLYDNEDYIKTWENAKKLNDNVPSLHYPLKQLSDFLFYSIFASMLAATLQMTVGLINHWLAAAVCIYFSLVALWFLLETLRLIKRNLDKWFAHLDKK